MYACEEMLKSIVCLLLFASVVEGVRKVALDAPAWKVQAKLHM